MSTPPPKVSVTGPSATTPPIPVRPSPSALQRTTGDHEETGSTMRPDESAQGRQKKKRNHRGGKKKRVRRQSFAAPSDDGGDVAENSQLRVNTPSVARGNFFGLHARRNNSSSSIESEALLDHREQQPLRPRRASTMGPQGAYGQSMFDSPTSYRPQYSNPFVSQESVAGRGNRPKTGKPGNDTIDDEDEEIDERAPLMSSSRSKSMGTALNPSGRRQSSRSSSKASRRKTIFDSKPISSYTQNDYNVNYPPSMPGSPELAASQMDMSFAEMLRDDFAPNRASPRANTGNMLDDYAVDSAEHEHVSDERHSLPSLPRRESVFEQRRHTIALQAEEDVCFPTEGMSEMADDDMHQHDMGYRRSTGGPRRRRGKWPDLAILDDWSRFEKEGRSDERRAKRITEPQLIGGRLRPIHKGWHRADDDAPYRFTYFNEEFQSTIHSQTISELVQPGGSFRELFIPDPPELTDSSSEDGTMDEQQIRADASYFRHATGLNGESRTTTRQSSLLEQPRSDSKGESATAGVHKGSAPKTEFKDGSGEHTPLGHKSAEVKGEKPKRYGERPTWWLDILSPTDAEMKVISKAFGIHPLTAEDIMMQEAREKVELFRNYYFVNYRSFEQDMNNEDFLEPVNMYVVVFREGVLSFHFSMTPHAANVRRRIRQLTDYLILSSDWISYAIIDDITDVFAPLIQAIEDEVDDIDDAILKLHAPDSDDKDSKSYKDNEKRSDAGDGSTPEHGGDMLRRVGDCRKKVMGLYRLLGNKADVIKGFAKRCNEHWDVAPRSEIGLYLGDIQDHIVTMTGNLSHYEKILARSHGNYLAQINIRMNERQEQTADVLGKLTVLGTIVLPMNIITGLWGMNVFVPGQGSDGLAWFAGITAGLIFFGAACFWIAKISYRLV